MSGVGLLRSENGIRRDPLERKKELIMTVTAEQQVDQFKGTSPTILVWEGQQDWQKPRYEIRYFHRRKIEVWSGYVPTSKITGWVENIRIQLFVEKWKRDHGGTPPTNDDILDWMKLDPNILGDKSREFELVNLADSIVKNGVRKPIVVTSSGTLLDGNRRYFAALMKLREAEQKGDKAIIATVAYLPAYVLSPTCSDDDLNAVLVEENFVEDYRKQWPNFIKAAKVYDAYRDLRRSGVTKSGAIENLMEVFGMRKEKGQIERWIRMMDHIQEFQEFHSLEDEETGRVPKDEFDIKWRTQRYFEYFDELSKTQVLNALAGDPEFRDKAFERLYNDDFVNFVQIRKLPLIINDVRAREKFMLGSGKEAVKDAIEWVTVAGIAKKSMVNDDRITAFKRFLEGLTASDITKLDSMAVKDLNEIAQKVASMAAAVHKKTR